MNQSKPPSPRALELVNAFAAFGPAYIRWVGSRVRGPIGPARMRLLAALDAESPMTMGQLRTILGTTKANLTSLVDALEGEGLVTRSPHPTDRRSTLVRPTPRARRMQDADWASHAAEVAGIFDVLSARERDQLLAIIRSLQEEIERREAQR